MSYYAVANGKSVGIFTNWNDCKNSVHGHRGAIYKKFDKKEDADAFIALHNNKSCGITTNEIIPKCDKFIPDYYVYTDGACSNNGRRNSVAGIGIYFGANDVRNVSLALEGKHTNNTAELLAIIHTYSIIENDLLVAHNNICIVTDSEYVIKCVTTYGDKCHKKHWPQDIPNRELVKKAYELYNNKSNIQFIHIRAHTSKCDVHSIGNDQADRLANLAIGCDSCPYQNK